MHQMATQIRCQVHCSNYVMSSGKKYDYERLIVYFGRWANLYLSLFDKAF